MSDWTWDYNPSEEYLTTGLPAGVVAEVERLATELAALGQDSVRVGRPTDREGGLREFDILGGRGAVTARMRAAGVAARTVSGMRSHSRSPPTGRRWT